MNNNECSIDFGRSFLFFRSTRVDHTPRLRLDALCRLTRDGKEQTFYLTCPCIGEAMYVERDLIHDPVSEFNFIAAPRDQFLLLKRNPDAANEIHSAHRFGEVMPTHDGKGARVIELDVKLAHYNSIQSIESYDVFRTALLNGSPINGRTSYTDSDGAEVVLEYPANTVNVAHDQAAWQVDVGPVVMPAGVDGQDGLEVSRLDLAYLVFNRNNYTEAVIRGSMSLGTGELKTNYYHRRRRLDCRNELFVAA